MLGGGRETEAAAAAAGVVVEPGACKEKGAEAVAGAAVAPEDPPIVAVEVSAPLVSLDPAGLPNEANRLPPGAGAETAGAEVVLALVTPLAGAALLGAKRLLLAPVLGAAEFVEEEPPKDMLPNGVGALVASAPDEAGFVLSSALNPKEGG